MKWSLRRWLCDHETMRMLKRGPDGQPEIPHVIVWTCMRCRAVLGETTAIPTLRRLDEIERRD